MCSDLGVLGRSERATGLAFGDTPPSRISHNFKLLKKMYPTYRRPYEGPTMVVSILAGNGSVLVEDGTITAILAGEYTGTLPAHLEKIETTNDIVTIGFIDIHRHSWQTAFKTLGSNNTLLSYLPHFGTSGPASTTFTPEDVYVGQLAGLYEALNAGVKTIVDFAHCAWSAEHARAALDADLKSGIRAVYAYNFGNYDSTSFTFGERAGRVVRRPRG